jgi:hypothetical protein
MWVLHGDENVSVEPLVNWLSHAYGFAMIARKCKIKAGYRVFHGACEECAAGRRHPL